VALYALKVAVRATTANEYQKYSGEFQTIESVLIATLFEKE
jgi:ATP/ADP translocase